MLGFSIMMEIRLRVEGAVGNALIDSTLMKSSKVAKRPF